jgi:glucosamine kinase
MIKLLADSGATKCEWCLLVNGKSTIIQTLGISPYFLTLEQIITLLQKELLPKIKEIKVDEIFFYGTGLSNKNNVAIIKKALKKVFASSSIEINDDLLAAARALCGNEKGIACILGTGCNSGYFNGNKIVKNSPGLGYILGDEGSGAYLGKKVIQYYLYKTFDDELMERFDKAFNTNKNEILDSVYKKPMANRYLAGFTQFLVDNRGHYMIENIIEDGLNDFIYNHIYKFGESWTLPINFVGSVAFGFKDVLKDLCNAYQLELGKVLKKPMTGLINYHK